MKYHRSNFKSIAKLIAPLVKRHGHVNIISHSKLLNIWETVVGEDISKKAHRVLNCRGVTRSDFKFYKNNFYILEINTQPGMTNLSLVPEIASYKGISFENLVEKILLDASINR